MSNQRIFDSLYSYIGGKRKLAKKILSYAEGEVFIDTFAGACSVSLLAKHEGYGVISNDISERSYISQCALIENSTEKISEEDIARLFLPTPNSGFIEKTFVPKHFSRDVARFLDNAFAAADSIENAHKRALLRHALIQYILSIRSFSRFGMTGDSEAIDSGKAEELLEVSSSSRAGKILQAMSHPFPLLCDIAEDINYAIVNTGKQCEANRKDVFEFLQNVEGDTVYFDPPYSGSVSYESTYEVLDSVLTGRQLKLPTSVFNRKDVEYFFHQMYERAEHIPLWLTSMGKNPDANGTSFDGDELLKIVKEYRPNSELVTFSHRWAINTMAGKDQKENIEYLIISRR